MRQILLFFMIVGLLYGKNPLRVGMDVALYPKFKNTDNNLAIKTMVDITVKSWDAVKKFDSYEAIEYENTSSLVQDYMDNELDVIMMSIEKYSIYRNTLKDNYSFMITIPHHENINVTIGLTVPKSKKDKKISYWRDKKLSTTSAFLLSDLSKLYFLKNFKIKRSNFFSKTEITSDEGLSILNVFFGKSDLALTSKESYDISGEFNPQITKKLAFIPIDKYKDIPFFIIFSKSAIKNRKKALESIKKSDAYSSRGKQLRKLLKAHGEIIEPDPKDINILTQKYDQLRQLRR